MAKRREGFIHQLFGTFEIPYIGIDGIRLVTTALEILSDFQVSIPEIGTRKARNIPFVALTSNNFRDMSDALKRRCLHLYIDYPERELETEIVQLKLPAIKKRLLSQLIESIQAIRQMDLKKKPSIAETLDWANALIALQIEDLSPGAVLSTLNVILKHRVDAEMVSANMRKVI